jgi:hypothetical protein
MGGMMAGGKEPNLKNSMAFATNQPSRKIRHEQTSRV